MIKTEVGKYEIVVKKVGRKWIEADASCKSQIEINDLTKNFEVGNKYLIYAKRKIDKNRYGTTIKYYPIMEEDFNESLISSHKEKCKELLDKYETFDKRHENTRNAIMVSAHNDDELLSRLKDIEYKLKIKEEKSELENLNSKIYRAMRFDASYVYKFNYIAKNIAEINKLKLLKNENKSEIDESIGKAFLKCFTCIKNMENIISKFDALKYLKDNYNCDNKTLLDEVKKECDDYCSNYIKRIRTYYNEGYAVKSENLDIFEYVSERIKEQLNELKEDAKLVDVSKFNYVIKNIFNIRTEESLNMVLNRLGVEYTEDVFNKYKAFDGKFYILSFRLSPEMFRIAKEDCGLMAMTYGDYIHTNEYVCTDPYMLLYKLLESKTIKLDNINDMDEESKIELWSNEITKPYTYRKEDVDGETYYFVTKELQEMQIDKYNAYYIVGWDKDTKRGFSHRLPWRDNKYENMTIKEIVYETFKYNEGYKRIQGDVIVKEYNIKHEEHIFERVVRNIVLNGKEYTLNADMFEKDFKKSEYKPADIINDKKYKTLIEDRIDYRKNMYVEGMRINGLNDAFDSCKLYCNGKEIFSSTTPVRFNFEQKGTKLKYNIYFEPITYTSKCDIKTRTIKKVVILDGEERVKELNDKDITAKTLFLGDHKVVCNNLDEIYSAEVNVKSILCIGEFRIYHSEHSSVRYGKENKAYKIELAIRHRKKYNINRD